MVPEAIEGSLMLASHALALVGVPMRRVIRVVQDQRDARYGLLRGYFHGADDDTVDDEMDQARLNSFTLPPAHGRSDRRSTSSRCTPWVCASWRSAAHGSTAARWPTTPVLDDGDTLVLSSKPEALALAIEVLREELMRAAHLQFGGVGRIALLFVDALLLAHPSQRAWGAELGLGACTAGRCAVAMKLRPAQACAEIGRRRRVDRRRRRRGRRRCRGDEAVPRRVAPTRTPPCAASALPAPRTAGRRRPAPKPWRRRGSGRLLRRGSASAGVAVAATGNTTGSGAEAGADTGTARPARCTCGCTTTGAGRRCRPR